MGSPLESTDIDLHNLSANITLVPNCHTTWGTTSRPVKCTQKHGVYIEFALSCGKETQTCVGTRTGNWLDLPDQVAWTEKGVPEKHLSKLTPDSDCTWNGGHGCYRTKLT